MRKDVECCFGILKGRFRILKTGIRLQSFTAVDNIWFTCCALHNYLLEVDGLHKQWARGVSSDYEREMGHHDNVEIVRKNLRPEIFRRLENPRNYDTSTPVPNFVHACDDEEISLLDVPFEQMRSKLVDHFHYRWTKNDVEWPSRNGIMQVI
jgi:Plant transposon protein